MSNVYGSKWIRPEKRLAIYMRDGFACTYCGRDLRDASPREVSLDHLLPRSAGGAHEHANLVTACLSCNAQRQDKPWTDYATGGAQDRIRHLITLPINVALAKAIIAGEAGDPRTEGERAE